MIQRSLSGQEREAALLQRLLDSSKSEFIAVYGRRRVGKTFLVRRFFQDQDLRYFEVVGRYRGPTRDQLEIFGESLQTAFHRGRRRLAPPRSWTEAFGMLEAAHRPRSGRYVLFFDELPWLAVRRSGCLSALEHFWNAWCQRRDDIVLMVCGSAASWRLRKLVHAKGGLHNRLTQTIRLLPFTLGETRTFFRDRDIYFTEREIAELYMSVGGVPHYLDHVTRGPSVAQLIDHLYLSADAPLADEFPRLFASLFETPDAYVEVVSALARERRGLSRNELLASVALPSGGGATTILANLSEGGFIESTIPFESLCLEHTGPILHALGISGVRVDASAWRHPDAQIDLVLDRADDLITLCEAKFTDGPFTITKKYAAELRNKMALFREATGTRKGLRLVFLTSYGLRPNAYARELVDGVLTLEDLFR